MILKAKAPYDFRLSAEIMREFDGEWLYLSLLTDNRAVLAGIRDEGTVEDPRLQAYIGTRNGQADGGKAPVYATISRMLNLEMDLGDFYRSVDDKVLLRIIEALRGLKVIHTERLRSPGLRDNRAADISRPCHEDRAENKREIRRTFGFRRKKMLPIS